MRKRRGAEGGGGGVREGRRERGSDVVRRRGVGVERGREGREGESGVVVKSDIYLFWLK